MGWNGSGGAATPQKTKVTPKKPSPVRGLVAGAVVVVLAAVVYFAFFSGSDKPQKEAVEKNRGMIKEVTPARAPTNKIEKVEKPKPVVVDPLNQKFGKLPDGRWTVPGRKKIHNIVTNYSNVAQEVPFRNGTEQLMYEIFSRQPGDMPMPLPRLSKQDMEHMAEILMDKNPVTDKDSEEMRMGKEVIQLAKDELRKYLKEGGTVETFFSYYHNELMKSYEERNDAVKMVFDMAMGDDPDAAIEFCQKVNERFAEKGIRPVASPERIIEARRKMK